MVKIYQYYQKINNITIPLRPEYGTSGGKRKIENKEKPFDKIKIFS